jgi:hypothetical protein
VSLTISPVVPRRASFISVPARPIFSRPRKIISSFDEQFIFCCEPGSFLIPVVVIAPLSGKKKTKEKKFSVRLFRAQQSDAGTVPFAGALHSTFSFLLKMNLGNCWRRGWGSGTERSQSRRWMRAQVLPPSSFAGDKISLPHYLSE